LSPVPRRSILTDQQRETLLGLPSDEATLLRHHVLGDDDLAHIRRRRRPQNRLGFALQLCAFRYPGRLLQPQEVIPTAMLSFIAAQIGVSADDLAHYAERPETRYQHSTALQAIYGHRPFEGQARQEITVWLAPAAERARSNEALARAVIEEFRRRKIIVPGATTVERLCAAALVAAERRIVARMAARLDGAARLQLGALIEEKADERMSRFVWLRQIEPGANSADVNRLLDRLDALRAIDLHPAIAEGVPAHRVTSLRRQGERYYADGLRDVPENRRLAILAACVLHWRAMAIDAIVETHDRIVGKLYRAAERKREEAISDRREAIGKVLGELTDYGAVILAAHEDEADIGAAVEGHRGWPAFRALVDQAATLNRHVEADPLDFVTEGYARFRRYAARLLEMLAFEGKQSAKPLLAAIETLKALNRRGVSVVPADAPLGFLRPKWRKRVVKDGVIDRPLFETAILFEIRNTLRSGDLFLPESRRHRDIEDDLIAPASVPMARLAVPLEADDWLTRRLQRLAGRLEAVAEAARQERLPSAAIEKGRLRVERLEANTPDGAEALILKLYRAMPLARITDVLLEADDRIGFSQCFTDLRTGVPCRDRIGVLTVLLADGVNLGLKKMADACATHSFWELLRIAKWHVRDETIAQALAMVVEAQGALPFASVWGAGETSASDGQHFPAGGVGEALNLVNARYGSEPGLKAYSHVSDQYAPFATQVIPATAHEAPMILDGLLGNDAGLRIKEHYADTGGFTDHVFALTSILGLRFAPRIRDLPDTRLYVPDPKSTPDVLLPLVGGRINQGLIRQAWPDVLRLAASMAAGAVVPSQILRKLAAYPRQNSLAAALREVGRVERSIFMLDWLTDLDLQRRVQLGLNKGEAHHALKRAISFNRRGEIRDRTSESQHHRIAALNLLAAIIINWNTMKLGGIVDAMTQAGEPPSPHLLAHVSPLGWEHITLTGEYRWPALG
jgi:TnpA family transposase